MRPHIPDIILK